jgi:hypothetical protein
MSGANAKNIFFTNVPKKLECFVPSSPLYQNKVDFLNNESVANAKFSSLKLLIYEPVFMP